MPTSFTVFGLTLYIYGLLIGLGIVVSALIAEQRIKKSGLSVESFWNVAVWIVIGGVLGARVWHVITDWQLYASNPVESLYLWNGGLSIIGALCGGLLTTAVVVTMQRNTLGFFQLSDALAVGVPFGQAIGRIGNWVNQELYGTPTALPWKLFIEEKNRSKGYEQFAYYHPLFMYELIGLLVLGTILWVLTTKKRWLIGSGYATYLYCTAYGWLRFFLEFIRIEKTTLANSELGINQVVMLVVAIGATVVLLVKWRSQRSTS